MQSKCKYCCLHLSIMTPLNCYICITVNLDFFLKKNFYERMCFRSNPINIRYVFAIFCDIVKPNAFVKCTKQTISILSFRFQSSWAAWNPSLTLTTPTKSTSISPSPRSYVNGEHIFTDADEILRPFRESLPPRGDVAS